MSFQHEMIREGSADESRAAAGRGFRHDAPLHAPERESGGRIRYRLGAVEVDIAARQVRRDGETVDLAPKEFGLLEALLRREGAAATRSELLREVWSHRAPVATRTVDTHIGELRRKLEDDSSQPEFIHTVRKWGYRIGRR